MDLFKARDVVVTDDWYPCFDGNRVHMCLNMFKSGKDYRVIFSVFGEDDFGVCMHFNSTSMDQARYIFNSWKKYIFDRVPDGVNVTWFYEHGFYHD